MQSKIVMPREHQASLRKHISEPELEVLEVKEGFAEQQRMCVLLWDYLVLVAALTPTGSRHGPALEKLTLARRKCHEDKAAVQASGTILLSKKNLTPQASGYAQIMYYWQ